MKRINTTTTAAAAATTTTTTANKKKQVSPLSSPSRSLAFPTFAVTSILESCRSSSPAKHQTRHQGIKQTKKKQRRRRNATKTTTKHNQKKKQNKNKIVTLKKR
jgi:hypothetical protein